MKLNSFCVIVTTKDNNVLFWSRPYDLDSAIDLAEKAFDHFTTKPDEVPWTEEQKKEFEKKLMELGLPPSKSIIKDSLQHHTNQTIESVIKASKGDMELALHRCSGTAYTIHGDGITLRLLHSSKT